MHLFSVRPSTHTQTSLFNETYSSEFFVLYIHVSLYRKIKVDVVYKVVQAIYFYLLLLLNLC